MAYVLRPHTGNNNLDGWEESSRYDDTAIKSIADPNGGAANLPITSIPSPFASMELVKRAFAYCADKNNHPDGTTIYHKLVSFALDILEILYNFNKYSNDIDIIPWDRNDLNNLLNSEDDDFQRLGKTLQLYLDSDEESFNFGQMSSIYMLNYTKGDDPINIIGGTSPTSLTIASSNDLDYVDLYLGNNHRALNSDTSTFLSLYQRDPDFFKFVYLMSKQPNFVSIYAEVNKYIQRCYTLLKNPTLKSELQLIQSADYNNYSSLTINAQTTIYFAGDIAMKLRQDADLSNSDFRIKLSKGKNPELHPLVLPYTTYTEPNMRYVSGMWDSNNKAPLCDVKALGERLLPYDGTLYPYLTVDDVFQPSIIETIFPIADRAFFTASFKGQDKGYLIPLKRTILNYISLEDLKGYTTEPTPRPIFELKASNNNTVKASIRIPIQKGKYITFERNYFRDIEAQPSENKGSIVECKFNLFLFPSYHIHADFAPQRIYVVDQDKGALTINYRYEVEAYCEGKEDKVGSRRINRADKSSDSFTSFYYAMKQEYDYVMLSNGRVQNMIIPLFVDKSGGTESFEFAVDFGTTNTHIEYTINGRNPLPLEITSNNQQILKLSSYSYASREDYYDTLLNIDANFLIKAIIQEFIPETVSKKEGFSFPLRTNLSTLRNANVGQRELISLADFTIDFGYEKQERFLHNRVLTDIKWSRSNNDAVKAYIEELLLLIRNTIAQNGGALERTTIKWFYPVSMSPYLKTRLVDSWESLCKGGMNPQEALISPRCTVVPISESIAPYYYYKNNEGVNSSTCTVVSIDVGGGTSDFVVYRNNRPEFISSVRFAGNNIFGDFYGMGSNLNGFQRIYAHIFKQKLEQSQIGELKQIFKDIENSNNTADLISFLFSLENNIELEKRGERISLSDELQNNYELKIVFLLFYAGILYYLSKLLAKNCIPSPDYITCSGTASKIFNIIGGTSELQQFTKILFDELGESTTRLEIKQVPNPKEITCKGGLMMTMDDISSSPTKQYYFGTNILDKQDVLKVGALNEIMPQLRSQVVDNYKEFIKFFFSLDSKISFAQYFGINDAGLFKKYEDILTEYAEQDFATVFEEHLKDFQENDDFEDSMFFYPLSGGIFRLAQYISNYK